MSERYSVMRTSRYGNQGANVQQLYSVMRRDVKRTDDVIRVATDMANRDKPAVNETIFYDVVLINDMGEQETIRSIEVEGKKSI